MLWYLWIEKFEHKEKLGVKKHGDNRGVLEIQKAGVVVDRHKFTVEKHIKFRHYWGRVGLMMG